MEDFFNTELFKRIDETSYDTNGYPDESDEKIEKRQNLNEKAIEYQNQVMEYSLRISDAIDSLENIQLQLTTDPGEEYLGNINFDREQYINFVIQNFYVKLSTLYDLMIILSSKILRLGIGEQEISDKHIIRNQIYGSESFIESIKDLNKIVQQHKAKRNTIVHRGFIKEQRLDGLKHLYLKYYHLEGNDAPSDDEIKEQTQKVIDDFNQEMSKIIKEISEVLVNYFNTVEGIFETNFYGLFTEPE